MGAWQALTGAVAPEPEKTVREWAKPSIAMLPFDNLGDDRDREYLAHGLTDDLITDLIGSRGSS